MINFLYHQFNFMANHEKSLTYCTEFFVQKPASLSSYVTLPKDKYYNTIKVLHSTSQSEPSLLLQGYLLEVCLKEKWLNKEGF